jgi:glycerophosphoryl diester phosphodiesterase
MSDGPPGTPPATAVVRAALGDFRRAWLALAGFELAFKLVLGPLAVTATAWALARLVATTGRTAVNNTDLAAFLLTPTGVAVAAFAGLAALSATLFQTTGILAVAALKLSGRKVTIWSEAAAVAGAVFRVLRFGAVQLGALVLISMPFAGVAGLTYLAFLSRADINYYLATRPASFWAAAVLAGLLAVAATAVAVHLYVRWSLALPILLFEGGSATAALLSSAARVRGAYLPIGATLLGWRLACGGIGAVVGLAFGWLAAEVLDAAGHSPRTAVAVAAVLFVVQGLLVVLGSYLLASGHGLLTLRWYAARGGRTDLHGPEVPPAARTWLVRLTLTGIVAGAAAVLVLGFALARPLGVGDGVEITAHRGDARAAPENTLPAFRAAADAGADWIELDAQLTADGVVIVHHDADFARITGGADRRRPGDMTLAEIRQLVLVDRARRPRPDAPVATLKEVIDFARGRIKVNIELKVYGRDRRIATAIARLLRDERFEDECVVASLDYESLRLARAEDSRLRTAAIVTVAVGDVSGLDVDALSVHAPLATDDLLRSARRHGKEVLAWTVDDVPLARRLVARGVRNLITDDVPALVEVRNEAAELTDAERLLLAYRSLLGARH